MKKFLLSIVALVCAVSLWAVPAYRGWQTKTQPDGSTIEVRQVGDEFYHYWESKDGTQYIHHANKGWQKAEKPIVQSEESKAKQASRSYNQQDASKPHRAVGTLNMAPRGLVILVNYSDVSFYSGNTRQDMDDLMNSENYTFDGATGSAREYYRAQSNEKYVPDFDVVGPYTLSNNRAHYGANDDEGSDLLPGDMVVEACKLADADGVDFTKYNNDGDSYIDFVYIIYAGAGEADSGIEDAIWPHNWDLANARYYNNCSYSASNSKVDGLYINNYACSGELKYGETGTRCGIGTIAHEFGHVLGLPDYYVTSNKASNYKKNYTPGAWSIMDYGSYNNEGRTPPNYSAFDKYYFGWLSPEVLAKDAQLDVTLTTDYASAYQITGGKTQQAVRTAQRIWYIENRQKTGWDAYLPGHGMLVWEVTYNETNWTENKPNNSDVGYTIVTANDLSRPYTPCVYNTTATSTSGTTFPGTSNVTSFTPATGCAITNIAENEGEITFKYNGGEVDYWTYGFEGTNCTITGEASGQVDKGEALNLTITPDEGFTLADGECWAVEMGADLLEYGTGFTYNEGTGAFSIASVTGNVYIIATAKEVPATITWMDKGVEFTTTQTSAGKLVLPADEPDACESKVFVGWGKSVISTPTDEAPALVKDGDDADQTTYYAVFATEEEGGSQTETYGFENTDDDTNWNINGPVKSNSQKKTGSYSGKINTNHTYVTYKNKVAVTHFSFQFARTSTNNNYYVYIETSSDGTNWTTAESAAMSTFSSSGTFKQVSKDFDGSTELFVRFHCYNTTAERFVDDITITYGGTTYSEYTTSCTTPENVTVTFNENGGEGTMEAQTVPYNTATALNANEFTKVGHTFAGWATTADGEVVYADEAEVTLKKNITLFAKWSINKYKINKAEVSNGTISTSPVDSAIYGATVTITATPNTHYTLGGISVVDANEQAVELTGNTFAMPASNVTVSAAFNEKATHTIRFFNNGVQVGADQVVHLDDTPEVPEDPTPCDQDEYTFVGWMKAAISGETTTAPTTVDDYTVTGDQDYYAVYSRTEEGEGTGTFDGKTAGTYKIYAQVGETKYYAQGTGSKISSTTNEANATEYTFEAVTSGFAIKTGTTYITYSSSTDLGTSNNAYTWTFASGTKGTWRANSSTSGRGWIFRAGSTNKFGGYSTGNITADGDYYDLEISGGASSTTYYTTAPDCSAEVYTISLNAGENGSLASSHESAKAGKTITITITPNEFFHLDTITANDGAVTLSGTGNTRTFTMPASDVTVAATFAEDDKYTVRFISEGEAISTQALHLGELAQKPAAPTASCDDYTFEGWWTAELAADNEEEKSWITNFTVTGDQDYYAIFSKTEEGGLDSLTLTQGPTSGSGYNTNYSTTENTAQGNTIYIASNNILNSSSSIQIKAGATNRIYNTSAMPGNIIKITVTATTNSANVYVGSSSVASGSSALTPTSGSASSTAVYTIASGNTYFAVGATSSYVIVSSIIVTFSSSTTYYTSTVSCGTTSVEDVQSDDVQCTKVLKDGQIYLMYKGTMYDVQGRRVK